MSKTKRTFTAVVIDASGRGAALVHKYSQSRRVTNIIAIPGNDLMQINSRVPVLTFQKLKTTSVSEILKICQQYKVDLIDVAQDNAVEAGLSDVLIKNGFSVIGPTRMAGRIEWDKAWAREFMKKYKLPIPAYKVFTSAKDAISYVTKYPKRKWFIKASGLAEGKGAIPAENKEQAIAAVKQMEQFGEAGKTFVIEEWLEGEEFSFFALTDGITYQIVGIAQDHKRLNTGDTGPNTGGMGCSTPPLIVDKYIYKQAEGIIKKTIQGLAKEKHTYRGVLYLGGIVVKGNGLPARLESLAKRAGRQVYIIEFNARWGSPEAEVLTPGITNDFVEVGAAIATQTLQKVKIKTDGKARVVVTGALLPGASQDTRELYGLEKVIKMKDVIVYGARVKKTGKKYFVSSGRLFQLVASGKTVVEARQKAYAAMSLLHIKGNYLHYRTDIGWRDVERMHLKK